MKAGWLVALAGVAHADGYSALPCRPTIACTAELVPGTNGWTVQGDAHYLDDATLGLKARLHRQSAHVPAISLSATLSVPTFAAAGYTRTYDALFTLYVTKDLGWLHADYNIGGNAWAIDGTAVTQAWTSLALSTALGKGFGVMAEGYAFSDAAPIAPRDAGLLAAVSYQPRWWLVLDAGGDLGLTATRVASLFIGVTVVAGELWPHAGI